MKKHSKRLPEGLRFGPLFDEAEVEMVSEVVRSGRLTQFSSSLVTEFEDAFAAYVEATAAIAVNSGTAALHTALAAAGIGLGDEVIVPAFTFIGTVGPILQQQAVPVFTDIDPQTFCISVEDAARKITPKTKAILAVDMFGHPADLDPLRELAAEHSLVLIEDACQAHGAKYKGARVGNLADLTCFSFYESKNMTTGEGGMITTGNERLAQLCRMIRHQGEENWGIIKRLGFNYRMPALQAALGVVQIKKLDKFNEMRRERAAIYTKALSDLDLQLPGENPDVWSVFHVYSFLLPRRLAERRDEIVQHLREERVPVGVAYPRPLYASPVFAHLEGPFECPVTEDVCSRVITLPTLQSIPVKIAETIGEITRDVLLEYME
jgi:dTDP-4-amino-4,6-dideoxygalactose transaminase